MDNLMDLIFGIVYNDHDSDLIGRDQVDDYTIDTCLTADLCSKSTNGRHV